MDSAKGKKTGKKPGSRNFTWASLLRAKTAAGSTAATRSRYGRNLAHSNFGGLEIPGGLGPENDGFDSQG